MTQCRYRYRDGSPKRKDWDGAHRFPKGQRPRRFPQYPVEASFTFHGPFDYTTSLFYTYEHRRPKAGAFWKRSCQVAKEISKEMGFTHRATRRPKADWLKQLERQRRLDRREQ